MSLKMSLRVGFTVIGDGSSTSFTVNLREDPVVITNSGIELHGVELKSISDVKNVSGTNFSSSSFDGETGVLTVNLSAALTSGSPFNYGGDLEF